MSYYRRIGRKHARQALKEFFDSKEELMANCDCPSTSCTDCLKQKALDIFYDFQLREAMDPNSRFRAPPDKKSEKDYTEAALDLIVKTVERSSAHSGKKESMIVDAEEAYSTGCELMGDIVGEVCDHLLPEDYSGDVKDNIREKCWKLFEEKLGVDIPMPKVHDVMKEYYDRGIHDTLEGIEAPRHPTFTNNLLHFPRRAKRYEHKLLINVYS